MFAISIRTDFEFLAIFAFGNKIELRHQARVAQMIFWFTVTIEAPLHRHGFDLGDDFHFVDPAVAGNATDAAVDVRGVIEVNKVRKVMDALPQNRIAIFKAFPNRLEQSTGGMNNAQIPLAASGAVAAMTVAACRCRRDRGVRCFFDRVMTITTIKFQLTRVQLVTERNRLFRLVANVNDRWMDRSEKTGRQVTSNGYRGRY